MLAQNREKRYPNLGAHYRVTSEETINKKVRYNCVAWAALGDTKKWWQAGIGPDFYWPKGVRDDDSFRSYEELFRFFRYIPTTITDRSHEIFYEKVALFAYSDGDFSHVSYQLFSGWTSKLGGWEDIRHDTLEALEGGDYGNVKMVLKRISNIRGFVSRAFFGFTSKHWPLRRPD